MPWVSAQTVTTRGRPGPWGVACSCHPPGPLPCLVCRVHAHLSRARFHAAGVRVSPVTLGSTDERGVQLGTASGPFQKLPKATHARPASVPLLCSTPGQTSRAAWPNALPSGFESLREGVRVGTEGRTEWGFPPTPPPHRGSRLRLGQGSGLLLVTRVPEPRWSGLASPSQAQGGCLPHSCVVPPAGPSTSLPASVPPMTMTPAQTRPGT